MSARKGWILGALIPVAASGALCYLAGTDHCLDGGGRVGGSPFCQTSAKAVPEVDGESGTEQATVVQTSAIPIPRELRHGEVTLRMVDSLIWRVEEGLEMEGVLWRLEIERAGRFDTIPDIRIRDIPVLVADTVVTGLAYREDDLLFGFRYRIGKGRLDTIPLGDEPDARSVIPEISPDGRYIAYWALKGAGEGRIEIADWPAQARIIGGPIQVVGGTDASLGGVHWVAADTLEYAIWVEGGLMVRGRWSPSGFGPVDTIQSE